MAAEVKRIRMLLVLVISITGLLPLALYGFCLGRTPTVTAQKAKKLLAESETDSVLVDVRDSAAYESEHILGAYNWPHDAIMALDSGDDIPEQLKDKILFLICDCGIESAFAGGRLKNRLRGSVYNVKGGMQAWIGGPRKPCPLNLCRLQTASGQTRSLPFREASLFEQWMACVAAFGIKPLYMVLSLILVTVMRRLRSTDLVALRWAFIFFLIGEGFCAANYLFFNEDSYLVEYLHSFGMVLAFGYTTYAIFEGLDLRLVKYSASNEKCAALGLCHSCIKHTDVPCALRRVFQWLILSFIILTFIPLLASLHPASYNTNILGTFYNYSHPVIFQLFEIRYAPMLAILFFLGALLILWFHKNDPVPFAKIFFAVGMGFFGFSMFRLILFNLYRDNLVWYVCWEEITELLYVGVAGIVLWIFRASFFAEKTPG